ncbi:MAG TPA: hypothetical protein VK652_20105 [Steroidobacteraceae bacterium]|nr:hypothetical protein [Steroidobacteraceae bacterium]
MQKSKVSRCPGQARACIRLGALAAGAFLLWHGGTSWAKAPGSAAKGAAPAASAHDGQHDFDFLLGSWKIHLKRMVHPLSGSQEWVEFDGTVVCKKVWDGKGEIEEFSVDAPEKNIHILGLALRLYNPASHQWSIYWANAAKGAIGGPPVVGEFKDGHGEFYDQEEFNGRVIFTRYSWSRINTPTPHFEQAYSDDGGKTWEVNWITDQTKAKVDP